MASTKEQGNGFVEWLTREMEWRGWTRSDLAREADTHPSVIGKILDRETALGVDVAKRIASALKYSQIRVFTEAGLIDDSPSTREDDISAIRDAWPLLTLEDQKALIRTARAMSKDRMTQGRKLKSA